jgi:hypothetical protein
MFQTTNQLSISGFRSQPYLLALSGGYVKDMRDRVELQWDLLVKHQRSRENLIGEPRTIMGKFNW